MLEGVELHEVDLVSLCINSALKISLIKKRCRTYPYVYMYMIYIIYNLQINVRVYLYG